MLREKSAGSEEKDNMLLQLTDARRNLASGREVERNEV